jgi:hypothetical protein
VAGVWRYIAGDDPRYADPAFDDSSWTSVTLPGDGPTLASGASWMRVRVRLTGVRPPEPLALLIPLLGSSYEVYVDGKRIGEFGEGGFGHVPQVRVFRFDVSADEFTLAIRDRASLRAAALLFSFREPVRVGPHSVLTETARQVELERRWEAVPKLLLMAATALAGLFFLVVALGRPKGEAEDYFYAGVVLVCGVGVRLPQIAPWLFPGSLARSLLPTYGLMLLFLPAWRGLFQKLFAVESSGSARALLWLTMAATAGMLTLSLLTDPRVFAALPAYAVLLFSCMIAVYVDLWRRGRRLQDALLLHAATGLYLGANCVFFGLQILQWTGQRAVSASPALQQFLLDLRSVGLLLFAFFMAILMNRRSARLQAERQRLAQELEAGAEVQAVLVPAHTATVPGWESAAAYVPASEVGGDFYWALADGDALVLVVGDVSGKGLRAAMLVTLIIGVLRESQARHPAAVLTVLNTQLRGQTRGGFVTCCCARFARDGQVTLANAGHPPPLVDDHELDLPSLPLGVAPDAEFVETVIDGQQFTFVSDGVIEAENAQRELFGFDRTREISGRSAQEIAQAAQAWGQNDDITVVTVRRMA